MALFVPETEHERRAYEDFERRFTEEDFERSRATMAEGMSLADAWKWIHETVGVRGKTGG